MKKQTTITFSVLLIAVFMLFNVGVPIVDYLCPMMSADNPVCGMMPSDISQQASLTNTIPACCAKYIVAERNTTPFVKIQDAVGHDELVPLQIYIFALQSPTERNLLAAHVTAESPPAPLFLLNSSLLI